MQFFLIKIEKYNNMQAYFIRVTKYISPFIHTIAIETIITQY